MKRKFLWLTRGLGILLFLCVLITNGCDSPKRYRGAYVCLSEGNPPQTETVIELNEGDSGVWTTNGKEVSFRWSIKGTEIRLHTKEGGVITGKIKNDTITITLPGDKMMSFKKRQPY